MDSIKLTTGKKRIAIERDGAQTGTLEFDPTDVHFAEKFYSILREFQEKQVEFERKAKVLDEAEVQPDAFGLPANLGDSITLMREVCEYVRAQIDSVFGPGTSQAVFGDALSFEAFEQFFTGLMPFFQAAREEKMLRYANQQNAGRVMK